MTRVRTGWRLAGASWSVLRKDGSLAVYPFVATLVSLVAFWVVAGIGIAVKNAVSAPWVVLPFLLLGVYAATYFVVYFNVALAAAAQQSIEGHDTGFRDGLRVARTRRGIVAKWALFELALGLLLSTVGALLNDAGARTLSNLVAAAAGLAWSVATFFVIPVFALEGLGPRDAMTRSATLVRSHWGEAVVGRTGIGAVVFLIALLPIGGVSVLATELAPVNPSLAGVADALVTLMAVAAIVLGTALSMIFRVEVYGWATSGEVAGAFSRGDVLAAFRSERSPEREPESQSDEKQPAPAWSKQQLEQELYRLADLIGDKDEGDRFWSAKVRGCADQVRAGKVWGLRNFLGLFGGMGSINDQPFSNVLRDELSGTYALASSLLKKNDLDSSRFGQREVVIRPWSEGHTGKGVVYGDGKVVTSEDVAPGEPSIEDIKKASRPGPPAAALGIGPDGACDVYWSSADEGWLAAQLRDHNPALHLGPPLA